MTAGAVVPAAGLGLRMGAGPPKALRLLAGEPLLAHALRGLRGCGDIGPVVVAVPADEVEGVGRVMSSFGIMVVAGGGRRQSSVALALAALPADVDHVLVHDAARCLTPAALHGRVIGALRGGAAAVVPVLPLRDSVRTTEGTSVRRDSLRAVQTPQGFQREVLVAAHALGDRDDATDDAVLAEAAGFPVTTVPGCEEAFKVTTPMDLLLAEAMLRG